MKKLSNIALVLVGAFSLFALSSCKKIWDQIKEHPDGAADNCRIDKISFLLQDDNGNPEIIADTAKVTYNSHGDPTTVIYSTPYGIVTGSPNKGFKYNSQHQLTGYFEEATEQMTSGLRWHKY